MVSRASALIATGKVGEFLGKILHAQHHSLIEINVLGWIGRWRLDARGEGGAGHGVIVGLRFKRSRPMMMRPGPEGGGPASIRLSER